MNSQVSPSVSAGAWLTSAWKLRASVSRAFRLPTYTDLYYHDPANVGNPNLRPERAWSYEGGVDWNPGGKVHGEVTVFQRRERDGIDYVRASLTDIWRATNFQRLNFTGIEASLKIDAPRNQLIELQFSGLRGAQDALGALYSKYSFNYPVQSGVVSWQALLPAHFFVRARTGVMDRYGRDPYGVLDLYIAENRGWVHPFLQLTNLTDTFYQEILGVSMPGRGVVGGVEVVLFTGRK
jgi:iron complex outermembrane receptor protein